MSEEVTPAEASQAKTFTQEEVNKIVAERAKRAVPGDYEDLKAKAARFDELEASKKTEAEKLQDELGKAEARAVAAERANARLGVLAESGIPAEHQELVTGDTPEQLEASAAKVKALLAATTPDAKANFASYVIPAEGGAPATALNGDGIESAVKNALGITA